MKKSSKFRNNKICSTSRKVIWRKEGFLLIRLRKQVIVFETAFKFASNRFNFGKKNRQHVDRRTM